MKTNKAMILTFAERCKNILSSSSVGLLHTVKADATGSNTEVYSSKVKYVLRGGRPYIWVPEKDSHNVVKEEPYLLGNFFPTLQDTTSYVNMILPNVFLDDRGSFGVTSPFPGPLAYILLSLKKTPARVALIGEVVPLPEEKFPSVEDSLRNAMLAEQKVINESNYFVTGVLSSSDCSYRSENLNDLLDSSEKFNIFMFIPRSCSLVDCSGCMHEVNLEDVEASTTDFLSPFAAKIIDGINQSEVRRRALILFCCEYMNANAKDACMLSIDRKGFDVLARVPGPMLKDGSREFHWKEFRFTFDEEAHTVEKFCSQLVQMEEDVVKEVKSASGLM